MTFLPFFIYFFPFIYTWNFCVFQYYGIDPLAVKKDHIRDAFNCYENKPPVYQEDKLIIDHFYVSPQHTIISTELLREL